MTATQDVTSPYAPGEGEETPQFKYITAYDDCGLFALFGHRYKQQALFRKTFLGFAWRERVDEFARKHGAQAILWKRCR